VVTHNPHYHFFFLQFFPKNEERMLKDLDGKEVEEPKPLLQKLGIQAQLVAPPIFLKAFTKYTCKNKGTSTDRKTLKQFAETYKIRWRDARKCQSSKNLDQCVAKFKDLNDLFTRKIKPSLTRVAKTHKVKPLRIVSPAECRSRIVSPTKGDAHGEFHIKNAKYTMKELLGTKAATWVKKPQTVAVFRLAPSDYHRVHSPVDARVVDVQDIEGEYYSVDSFMLPRKAVLQKNARKVLSLELAKGVRGALVIIGATCVGSIDVPIQKGAKIRKGQDLGDFKFGGSCVVLVLDHKTDFHPRMEARSDENEETYLRVGQHIGDIFG
jgi:phosphatidylserine decarboxylase precursor